MELFDCVVGQRVLHKETGKLATIKTLWRADNEVEIQFDSGSLQRVNPRHLAASEAEAVHQTHPVRRPCPKCGADLGHETKCAKCGFEYRQAKSRNRELAVIFLLLCLLVGVILGLVAWKFMLTGPRTP